MQQGQHKTKQHATTHNTKTPGVSTCAREGEASYHIIT